MRGTRIACILSLVFLLVGCGPPGEVESPAGKAPGAGGDKPKESGAAGGDATLEFMGVSYTVGAEPFQELEGWGVKVLVSASIVDGKDHAFVKDTIEASEGPTSLRFVVQISGTSGEQAVSEDQYTGPMDLEVLSPGGPVELTRSYPGPKGIWLGPGDQLGLTVGIWGTEDADGGQRYSPNLARIDMVVSGKGKPAVQIQALDPNADLPKDYASWEIGTHKLVIKPFYPLKQISKTGGGENSVFYQVGETVVRIKGEEELAVGDKFYGVLSKGDGILVDHGEVLVDAQVREGEVLDKADLVEFYPVPMSEHELAGHKIILSPGATKYGMMSVGEIYKIVLDDREVKIEGGKLYVDGVCYGKIGKKGTINIFFDEIMVGKQKRKPQKSK